MSICFYRPNLKFFDAFFLRFYLFFIISAASCRILLYLFIFIWYDIAYTDIYEVNIVKKAVSLLLALCLLLCALAPAALAAPAENTGPRETPAYPLVIVRGMDFTQGLKYNAGTPEETAVNVMNNLSFRGVLKGIAGMCGGFFAGGKDGAVNALIDFAATLFEGYACNENGDSLDPAVSSPCYTQDVSHYPDLWRDAAAQEEGLVRSAAERYGAGNVYFFIYDWRLDTLENAGKLHALIETALADHGCDKVDLVCCSMGGIVALTYLNYYGSAQIDSLVSDSATMYGTDVTTDLLLGDVVFEPAAAYRFIKSKVPRLGLVLDLLYKSGAVTRICKFLNRFAETYKTEIYEGVLTPVFGSMPAIWELVRNESYEEAKQYIFGGSGRYAGMLQKTDKIQREVVARKQEILNSAMAQGMKFGVLAAYNSPNAPAYAHAALQGDGTLETRMMSFGATVSEVGGALPEESLAGVSPEYISADRCINASTCLYPEYTWFIKDAAHVGCRYGSDYTELVFSILEAESQPTVRTWAKYPRFLQADENEDLSPLTAAPGKWDRKNGGC